jgi:ubiquinol-cytochrome c reductase cytochrome b subunit
MSKSISIKSIISRYIINIIIDHRSKVHNLVGPYNNDIISIIYGSLLGDAFAERRKGGKGTRICFYQEGSHKDYLLYLHSLIANLGYCNTNIPKIKPRLGVNGKIRYIIRFST